MPEGDTIRAAARDRRLAGPGADVMADQLDEAACLRRLREDDQSRGIGEAPLEQRNVAEVGDDEALRVLRAAREGEDNDAAYWCPGCQR